MGGVRDTEAELTAPTADQHAAAPPVIDVTRDRATTNTTSPETANETAELRTLLAESEKQRTELWEWCNTRITELEAANERLVREKTELWEWCEPQIRNAHPTVWSFTRSQLGALARRLKLR